MHANSPPSWAVVSTIKAPARDVLRFAAHHLEAGATRLHIYLDEPNPDALPHLQAHPQIRVITCGGWYWKQLDKPRPATHQRRQTINATHAYYRAGADWLTHIDVDEFLWSEQPIADLLATLPDTLPSALVAPLERLSGRADHYKAAVPETPERDETTRQIYPGYSGLMKAGFMSHTKGKCFARTGLRNIRFHIHAILQAGEPVRTGRYMDNVDLCHHHCDSWDQWRQSFDYRLHHGSYRPDLSANKSRLLGGLNKHEVMRIILEEQGEDGLRSFFDAVTAADPQVFQRLCDQGLIRKRVLDLDAKLARHFPEFP